MGRKVEVSPERTDRAHGVPAQSPGKLADEVKDASGTRFLLSRSAKHRKETWYYRQKLERAGHTNCRRGRRDITEWP